MSRRRPYQSVHAGGVRSVGESWAWGEWRTRGRRHAGSHHGSERDRGTGRGSASSGRPFGFAGWILVWCALHGCRELNVTGVYRAPLIVRALPRKVASILLSLSSVICIHNVLWHKLRNGPSRPRVLSFVFLFLRCSRTSAAADAAGLWNRMNNDDCVCIDCV